MSQTDQQLERQENGGPEPTAMAVFGWKEWLFAAALVVAVFLVYQPAWRGGFIWDDDVHLLDNPVLKPGGLAKIWVPGSYINYWPLTFTVYWAEFEFGACTPRLPPRQHRAARPVVAAALESPRAVAGPRRHVRGRDFALIRSTSRAWPGLRS